jgi:hypothetical protein
LSAPPRPQIGYGSAKLALRAGRGGLGGILIGRNGSCILPTAQAFVAAEADADEEASDVTTGTRARGDSDAHQACAIVVGQATT